MRVKLLIGLALFLTCCQHVALRPTPAASTPIPPVQLDGGTITPTRNKKTVENPPHPEEKPVQPLSREETSAKIGADLSWAQEYLRGARDMNLRKR